jgi:hypothetical protein
MEIYDMMFDYLVRMGIIFAALFALILVFSKIYKED